MQNRLNVVSDIFSAFPLHRRTTVMGKVAGALLAVSKIKNAVPLIHGPVGCAYQRRINPFELSSNFYDVPCTNMTELDTVYGGEETLKESIRQTYERYHPNLIVVITTCQSDIIGDDVKAVIDEIKEEVGCDIIYSTGGFARSYARVELSPVGYQDVLYAIADQLLEERERIGKSVNIATYPIHGSGFGMGELRDVFEKIGIKINGVYFDGATVDDLKNMPRADLNLVDYPQGWAMLMKEKFGIDYIETQPLSFRPETVGLSPYGVKGSSKFFMDVAKRMDLDKKAEEIVEEKKKSIEDEINRLREKLEGKSFAVSAMLFFHSGIIPVLLSDLNLDVKFLLFSEIKAHAPGEEILKYMKRLLPETCKRYGTDPEILAGTAEEEIAALKSVDMAFVLWSSEKLRYESQGIKAFNAGSFSEHYGRIGFKTTLDLGEMLLRDLNKHGGRSPLIGMLDFDPHRASSTKDWAKLEEVWTTLWAGASSGKSYGGDS